MLQSNPSGTEHRKYDTIKSVPPSSKTLLMAASQKGVYRLSRLKTLTTHHKIVIGSAQKTTCDHDSMSACRLVKPRFTHANEVQHARVNVCRPCLPKRPNLCVLFDSRGFLLQHVKQRSITNEISAGKSLQPRQTGIRNPQFRILSSPLNQHLHSLL